MRSIFIGLCLLPGILLHAQSDTVFWQRAFPITDYMLPLNDSVTVVQVYRPGGKFAEKQFGVIFGAYDGRKEDAVAKGYGRCHLIKGDYYYFTIGKNKSGIPLKAGDLLYVREEQDPNFYTGKIVHLALHYIHLQNVYEKDLYQPEDVLADWTAQAEKDMLDSLVYDIQLTGQHMLENDPSVDKLIDHGTYKGRKLLYIMAECQKSDVKQFLDYIIARPRIYAGKKWKISEIFATWVNEGGPLIYHSE